MKLKYLALTFAVVLGFSSPIVSLAAVSEGDYSGVSDVDYEKADLLGTVEEQLIE